MVIGPEMEGVHEANAVIADLRHKGNLGVADTTEANEQCRSDLTLDVVDIELGAVAGRLVPVAPLIRFVASFVTKLGFDADDIVPLPGAAEVDSSTELFCGLHAFDDTEEAGGDTQVVRVALAERRLEATVDGVVNTDGDPREVGQGGRHEVFSSVRVVQSLRPVIAHRL